MPSHRTASCPRLPLALTSAARLTASLLLFVPVAAAQNGASVKPAASARVAQFTLAAGDHDLGALVDLLAQIRKAKIECNLDALAAPARRLRLQNELRLEADAWDDVVTTLLRSRGLVLAPADPKQPGAGDTAARVVAVTQETVPELLATAEPREPDQVLARPNRLAFVRSFHVLKKLDVNLAINMMRPVFAAASSLGALNIRAEGNKVIVTGCTDDVACALHYLRSVDGQELAAVAMPASALPASPESAWPERELAIDAFLDQTAKVLGVNIVWQPDELASAAPIPAGTPRPLGPAAWHVEATRALRQAGFVMLPLDEGRRVFEVVPLQGPRARWITKRATPCTPERVLANDMPIEPVWVIRRLQHVEPIAAINKLRPVIMGLRGVTTGPVENGLGLWGLSDSVAAVLTKLAEIDIAASK